MNSLHDHRKSFISEGYTGPLRLLPAEECHYVATAIQSCPRPPVWNKATATTSNACYNIAVRSELLSILEVILGRDIILWGSCLITKKPGEIHPWHVDSETIDAPKGLTASVWIGLVNTNKLTSLKLVSHSHKFGTTLPAIAHGENISNADIETEDVVRWARSCDPASEIIEMDMADGEALIFDGRLWHGSYNTHAVSSRTALLLQYATPDFRIRVPDSRNRYNWPFGFLNLTPPCIMVRGTDAQGINKMTAPPKSAKSNVGCKQRDLDPLVWNSKRSLQQCAITGWKTEYFFEGRTPSVDLFSVHASVLAPEIMPHLIHSHDEDELLILLEGSLEIIQANDQNSQSKDIIGPGSFVYHPARQLHTMRSVGPVPAHYYVIKWRGTSGANEYQSVAPYLFNASASLARSQIHSDGEYTFTGLYSAPTAYLRRLHIHIDNLAPGAGYPEHRDPYDIAILVHDGVVEIPDHRVGKNGLFLHPADQPHSLKNVGDKTASLLVIEFHGSRGEVQISSDRLDEMRIFEANSRDAATKIKEVIPYGARIILVDEDQLGPSFFPGYNTLPFLEHDGEYWGAPPYDQTAIEELERMRSSGAEFLVFCWPAFWWLKFYRDFTRHLEHNFTKLATTDTVVVYDLRKNGSA